MRIALTPGTWPRPTYLSRAEERAKNRSKFKAPQADVDDDTEDDPDKKQDDKKTTGSKATTNRY
jgi:hypothetical protein